MKKAEIAKFQKWAETWIEFQRRKNKIPGVAYSVFTAEEVISQNGLGFADLEKRISISPIKTKFHVGSITKSITAFAIAQLDQRGLIDVNDSVSKYFPEYKSLDLKIKNLLSHTSGIKRDVQIDVFNSEYYVNQEELKNELFLENLEVFKPGKKFKFSNLSFALLGLLIEKVSKVPFDEYINEKIFKPIDNNHSHFGILKFRKSEAAKGYGKIEVDKYHNETRNIFDVCDTNAYAPSVGLITSVNDLTKFAQQWFLKNEKLLSKDIKSKFLKTLKPAEEYPDEEYSMGLKIWKYKKNIFYGYEGDFRGVKSCMILCPRHNLGSIVISNSTNNIAKSMSEVLIEMAIKISNITKFDESLTRFEGIFANNRADIQIISLNSALCYYNLESVDPIDSLKSMKITNEGFFDEQGVGQDSKGERIEFDFAKKNCISSIKFGSEVFYPKVWD